MFTWETAIFNATLTSFGVATVGTVFGVDSFYILVGVAIAGSLASVGLRWMNGHLKDWKNRCMAFICGVMLAVVAIPYLETKGLVGLSAGLFVLGISLIGARVIKYVSTDLDIRGPLDGFMSRFRGKG